MDGMWNVGFYEAKHNNSVMMTCGMTPEFKLSQMESFHTGQTEEKSLQ